MKVYCNICGDELQGDEFVYFEGKGLCIPCHEDNVDSGVSITMPLYFMKPRKTMKDKRLALSMNAYRNRHYHTSNWAKKHYKEVVEEKLTEWGLGDYISITMVFYKNSRRRADLDNWCAIQEKFVADALVELGYIEDDTTEYIKQTHHYAGGLDSHNGRVEISFRSLSKE